MSTKIRNGYRLSVGNDLQGLHTLIEEFRSKARQISYRDAIDTWIVEATKLYDQACLDHYEFSGRYNTPLSAAKDHMLDSMDENGEVSLGFHSYFCRVRVVPLFEEDMVLAFLHFSDDAQSTLWRQFDQVEYFPYWNDVDPPDDISREEWKKREQIWTEAAGGSLLDTSRHAMDFPVVKRCPWKFRRVQREMLGLKDESVIPPFGDRVERRLDDVLFRRYLDEHADDSDDIWRHHVDFQRERRNNGEDSARYREAKDYVVSTLVDDLTLDRLAEEFNAND